MPSSVLGKVLETGRFEDNSKMSVGGFSGCHFGATWAILCAISDPAGAKRAPKSGILAPNVCKMSTRKGRRTGARINTIY